jgi:hypothetical protein
MLVVGSYPCISPACSVSMLLRGVHANVISFSSVSPCLPTDVERRAFLAFPSGVRAKCCAYGFSSFFFSAAWVFHRFSSVVFKSGGTQGRTFLTCLRPMQCALGVPFSGLVVSVLSTRSSHMILLLLFLASCSSSALLCNGEQIWVSTFLMCSSNSERIWAVTFADIFCS